MREIESISAEWRNDPRPDRLGLSTSVSEEQRSNLRPTREIESINGEHST